MLGFSDLLHYSAVLISVVVLLLVLLYLGPEEKFDRVQLISLLGFCLCFEMFVVRGYSVQYRI